MLPLAHFVASQTKPIYPGANRRRNSTPVRSPAWPTLLAAISRRRSALRSLRTRSSVS